MAIASDVGIERYPGEGEVSFFARTAYSASRFWAAASCMDDGLAGTQGLTKQALNRRLKAWIADLGKVAPGVEEWFQVDDGGVAAIYERLLDIEDLLPSGTEGRIKARRACEESVLEAPCGLGVLRGFYDASSEFRRGDASGLAPTTSGLCSIVETDREMDKEAKWWTCDTDYMQWDRATAFETVRYADPASTRWNLRRPDAWTEKPSWMGEISLAKVETNEHAGDMLFVAKRARGRVMLSRIDRPQAQELFFAMRAAFGNPATTAYCELGPAHFIMKVPIGFLPSPVNGILDAASWPVANVNDAFDRIVRAEALPLYEEGLRGCSIMMRKVSNGGRFWG